MGKKFSGSEVEVVKRNELHTFSVQMVLSLLFGLFSEDTKQVLRLSIEKVCVHAPVRLTEKRRYRFIGKRILTLQLQESISSNLFVFLIFSTMMNNREGA